MAANTAPKREDRASKGRATHQHVPGMSGVITDDDSTDDSTETPETLHLSQPPPWIRAMCLSSLGKNMKIETLPPSLFVMSRHVMSRHVM